MEDKQWCGGTAIASTTVLLTVFRRPQRWYAALLVLAGAVLAGMSAVLSVGRLGAAAAVAFSAVTMVCLVVAVAVARAARWALWLMVVVSGGQIAAVIGTVWELATGIDATKADQLRRLGFNPTAGVVINLVYSALAVMLFGWLAMRWRRVRIVVSSSPPSIEFDIDA